MAKARRDRGYAQLEFAAVLRKAGGAKKLKAQATFSEEAERLLWTANLELEDALFAKGYSEVGGLRDYAISDWASEHFPAQHQSSWYFSEDKTFEKKALAIVATYETVSSEQEPGYEEAEDELENRLLKLTEGAMKKAGTHKKFHAWDIVNELLGTDY